MDSNQPTKKQSLWDIMSELSSNLDGVQEEVTESSNFKQPKINLTTAGASTITKEDRI